MRKQKNAAAVIPASVAKTVDVAGSASRSNSTMPKAGAPTPHFAASLPDAKFAPPSERRRNVTAMAKKSPVGPTPAPAPRWGTLNFNSTAKLPPSGTYAARISDVKLTDKSDVLWLAVGYTLETTDARPRDDIAAIAALPTSNHVPRVPDGLRLLYRLSQATGVDLNGIDPNTLPGLLIGKRVTLTLAHRQRDGQPDLVVREIRPPA